MKLKLTFFLIFIYIIFSFSSVFAMQTGQIEYTVPIDYSLLDENTLNSQAEVLFNEYKNTSDPEKQYDLLNKMLSNYSLLAKINKDNPLYFVRLGIIYDKLGKDRYAKSNFCRGSNLIPDYPYAFYAFGNYFFDRADYRKALREYIRAYNTGYDKNYYTLYQIGVVYEKLADYSTAIKYFNLASSIQPSEELSAKIQKLELLLEANSLYNQERGLYK